MHRIPQSCLEYPQHKRVTLRNRQMGKHAFNRNNFWNNNHSCYSVWNSHVPESTSWHFRPPVHGNKLPASYIIFSYGKHFPLFVYDNQSGLWFENSDKYSVTTTIHKSDAHPRDDKDIRVKTIKCNTDGMLGVAKYGMVWAVRHVLTSRV